MARAVRIHKSKSPEWLVRSEEGDSARGWDQGQGGWTVQGLAGPCQNFGFHSKRNENPLEECEQRGDLICCIKGPLWLLGGEGSLGWVDWSWETSQSDLHVTSEKRKRDQRSLPDAWPGRVGLLLLKTRRTTVEGANWEGELGEWMWTIRNLALDMPI